MAGTAAGDDRLPQDLRQTIARRLLHARRLKGWSVREVAAQTGVSKALISRLERGEANPSLETLWRIIGALGIPFSELVRAADEEPQLVRRGQGQEFVTEDESMQVSLLSASPDRAVEIYELTMPPRADSEWHSHGQGTREYTFVVEGRLTVQVASERFELAPGDLLGFAADRDHVYRSGDQDVRLLCVMRYGR
jgi:transcriptional regulator with XRE-family HTH domain